MLVAGQYISSDEIHDESTFNKLIETATSQGIKCEWTWTSFSHTCRNKRVRLVVREWGVDGLFIDVEGSPFDNRVRIGVDDWLKPPAPVATNEIVFTEVINIHDVATYFRVYEWLSNNMHKMFGVNEDDFNYDSWDTVDGKLTVFYREGQDPSLPLEEETFYMENIVDAMTFDSA